MDHFSQVWLSGQEMLNVHPACTQIRSYKLWAVTVGPILGERRKNLGMSSKKWIIRRLGLSFKNLPASSHIRGVRERQMQSAQNILLSLLNTHGRSLNDEPLRTLLAETEATLNFRPLTINIMGDVQSEQPACQSNILTMKSKAVLPPPGQFAKAYKFSRRRWRCIQHIANESWVRRHKEFLWSQKQNPSKTEQKMHKLPEESHCAIKNRGQL